MEDYQNCIVSQLCTITCRHMSSYRQLLVWVFISFSASVLTRANLLVLGLVFVSVYLFIFWLLIAYKDFVSEMTYSQVCDVVLKSLTRLAMHVIYLMYTLHVSICVYVLSWCSRQLLFSNITSYRPVCRYNQGHHFQDSTSFLTSSHLWNQWALSCPVTLAVRKWYLK